MRTVRIFSPVPLADDQTVELSGTAARHTAQVLRMKEGESVTLFDGSGDEYTGTIQSATKSRVTVQLGKAKSSVSESPARISLWHGLCRSSRMDNVIQKATELGVSDIQPLLTEHGIVRLDSTRGNKKLAHWQKVAVSACEQSGRTIVPVIRSPVGLDAALHGFSTADRSETSAVMCDPAGEPGFAQHFEIGHRVILLTGPEGGFSQREKAAARDAGFSIVSLGPRVLRTETAPIVALGLIQSLVGDLS